jgi:hypothetical protein
VAGQFIGKLLKNKRADESLMAWNRPNLAGPETLALTSEAFEDGGPLPLPHAGRRIGGADLSPDLAWPEVPVGTAEILLVAEDIDAPFRQPIVHAVALIDPAVTALDPGALSGSAPGVGVRTLRSFVGRGYRGPGPIPGHGPHRYVFQVFALGAAVQAADGARLETLKPGAVLGGVGSPVLGRGKIVGTYER